MPREWIATIGSGRSELHVELVGRPNHTHQLRITGLDEGDGGDGEAVAFEVDAAQLGPRTWSLILGGEGGHRSVVVDLIDSPTRPVAVVGGTDLDAVLEDARKKRLAESMGQAGGSTGETVKAPIAGRLVKVLVEIGDEVEIGRSLVVLEAMKMENELKAAKGGTVESITGEPGQSVEAGQVLVKLV